ncbi:MAG: RNA polymerase sigma-70 factor [Cyclobacteriaceae bacterium]
MALFGDHMQFEMAYKQHYSMLVGFAFQYVEDGDSAEDVVQEVFSNLWNQSDRIEVKTNVKSYLFGAVRNACLNHIKHLKVVESHAKMTIQSEATDPTDFMEMDELQEKIDAALAQLPEKRREIFELSRFQEKKYHEIAEELNISIKTVETQMSRALKVMREVLGSYLMYLIIFSLIMLIEGCRGKI